MSKLAENVRKAAMEQQPENAPQGTNTADLQAQLAVGATGKGQAAGQNLKQSNIAEQLGMVNARGAQQEVKQQGMEQATQVANAEAAAQVQTKQIDSANRIKEREQLSLVADRNDEMLAQIKFSESNLAAREDALQLEQLGASLRLGDQKYRHELEMVGTRNRLDNRKSIALEAQRLAIGEQKQQLYQKLANKYEQDTQTLEAWYDKNMMKVDEALEVAMSGIEDDMNKSIITNVGGAITAGVSGVMAADAQGMFDSGTGADFSQVSEADWAAGQSLQRDPNFNLDDLNQNQSKYVPAPWETAPKSASSYLNIDDAIDLTSPMSPDTIYKGNLS